MHPLSRHQLPLCHDRDAVATEETASWQDHLPVPAVPANVGKMAGPNHPHGEPTGLGEGVFLGPADDEDRSGRLDVGGDSELSHRFRRPGVRSAALRSAWWPCAWLANRDVLPCSRSSSAKAVRGGWAGGLHTIIQFLLTII
jgi:hypothetical protein